MTQEKDQARAEPKAEAKAGAKAEPKAEAKAGAKAEAQAEPPKEGKQDDGPRVGVFVCDCGLNIAGSVDCAKVTEYAATLPDVVFAGEQKYTCSDPGQQLIQDKIKEFGLNRVVVASCSPRLHEPTFRGAVEKAGLNRYLFEMANIREHCSWIHLYDREGGTEKAKDIVRMAVAKARLLEPQEETKVPVTQAALVIGGGVAGIQAALDLADSGFRVHLVEKEPSIGGRMAQIDKTFPTMDCSICILAPKMSEAGKHPNITLHTYSEVLGIEGYIGNFKAKILHKARYVTKDCTACGDCAKVCEQLAPNEFDMGLATRKGIYIPFAQAVPSRYVIDVATCLGTQPIACGKCLEKCERKAIDLEMRDEVVEVDVGTVVVATGIDVFDAMRVPEYHYGEYPDVITTMEFERLVNAGGPTGGHLVRPSSMGTPKSIAFIQCVGSRSLKSGNPFCSNVCCMNTIKDSLLIREHYGHDVKIDVYYMDIRAFGKGFEDLYNRAKGEGVRFIRGIPAAIKEVPGGHDLRIVVEDTSLGRVLTKEYEMVILSVGIEARHDAEEVQRLLTLSRTGDGFFLEAHPKLKPVDAPTKGVFLCGCAEGPKDIKDSVTQASAAAARAGILMHAGEVTVEAITARVDEEACTACGACAKVCPYHAITVDMEKHTPAHVIEAACAGCGTCAAECPFGAITQRHFTDEEVEAQIDAATATHPERLVLTFACNWCSYAGADFAGVSRMQMPPNARVIRTMCSGRISEDFVLRAFKNGAATVLVSGCHIGDCHYINANHQTKKRVERLWKRLEGWGVRKERLGLEWVSAAEGAKFQSAVGRMVDIAKTVTPEELEKSKAILAEKVKPKRKGKAKRKAAEGGEAPPPVPKPAAKDAA
jgi:heterodisulfide reductase subunit A